MHELCQSGSTASFAFLSEEEERMLFLNHAKQTFEFTEAQTSGLVNLALSRKTGFFECEHPLIDKPMALTDGPNRCSKCKAIRPGFETIS